MNPIRRLLVALLPAALCACGSGSLSSEEGNLRLVNATSEFASLDLFANGSAAITGVASYTSSGYANLDHNSYTLDLRASGSSTSLVTTSTTLAKKDHQTVVAYTSGGTLTTAVLSDQEGDPSGGNAKVRVFNTATVEIGAVDVYLVADCASLATSGAAAFAANVSGLQSGYTQITASATPVHVCVTAPGDKTDLRLDIPSLTLSDKRIVTIILVRTGGGFLLNGLLLDQQSALTTALNALARVRVAASLSPAVPISVDVNSTAVAAGLTTPNVGPYQVVSAGTLAIKINGVAYTPATPLTAAAGSDVTLLLTGSTPTVTLLNDDNTVSTSTTRPVKLRLVNGLNGTTGAATLTVDNALVGNGAASPGASAYALLPASAALARVEARTGVIQLYLANNVTLTSGRVYSLFLLGDAAAAPNTGILVADR